MTRAVHRTVFTVSAIAGDGFALPLLFDHIGDDRGNDADKHGADDYSPNVAYDPR